MNPVLALAFSLIAPGSGQILNGQYGKGVVLGVLFALGKSAILPLFIRFFGISSEQGILRTLYAANWLSVLVIVYALADAVYDSFVLPGGRILTAVLAAFMIVAVYKNTFNNFIFTSLCGRAGIYPLLRRAKKSPTEK